MLSLFLRVQWLQPPTPVILLSILPCHLLLLLHDDEPGWRFDGLLAHGDNSTLGIRGQDWECPILSRLPVSCSPPSISANVKGASSPAASTGWDKGHKQLPHQILSAIKAQFVQDVDGTTSDSSSSFQLPQTPCYSPRLPCPPSLSSDLSSLASASPAQASFGSPEAGSSRGHSTSMCGDVPASLTEPVLAAAAVEAGTVADDCLQHHPNPKLTAWLQQTQHAVDGSMAAAGSSDRYAPLAASSSQASLVHIGTMGASTELESAARAHHESSPAFTSLPLQPMGTGSARSVGTVNQDSVALGDDDLDYAYDKLVAASDATPHSGGQGGGSRQWWFCISPDACNNPITWWLGDFNGSTFDVAAADGPHRLDLGTTLYAATLWEDPQVCIAIKGI